MKKIYLLLFLCSIIGRVHGQFCGTPELTEAEFKALPYYGNNAYLQNYMDSLTTVFNNPANRVEEFPDVWYRIPIQFWVYTWQGQNSFNRPINEVEKRFKTLVWYLNDAMQRNQVPIRFYMLCPRFVEEREAATEDSNFLEMLQLGHNNFTPQALNCHIVSDVVDAAGIYISQTNAIYIQGVNVEINISGSDEVNFNNSNRNGTFIHEVGHWLGLNHTHLNHGVPCLREPVSRGVFSSACTLFVPARQCEIRGDGLCDTPADPKLSDYGSMISNCNWVQGLTDFNGDMYNPQVSNYMSYANDNCITTFTHQQKTVLLTGVAQQQMKLGTSFLVNPNTNFDIYEPDNIPITSSTIRFNEPQIHSFSSIGSCNDDSDWLKFVNGGDSPSLEDMYLEIDNIQGYNNPVLDVELWDGGGANGQASNMISSLPLAISRLEYSQINVVPPKIIYTIPCSLQAGRVYLLRIVRNGNQTGRYMITLKRRNPQVLGNNLICGASSFSVVDIPSSSTIFWSTSPNISPRNGSGSIANINPSVGGDAWIDFTILACGKARTVRKPFISGLPIYNSITVSGSLVSTDGASFQTFPEGNHTLQISANNSVIVRRTRYIGTTASPTQTCGSPCTFTLRRGEYHVFSIQSTNSCGTAYATVIVAAPNVIPPILARVANSTIEEKPLKVYPNPVAQELFIENAEKYQRIALYDRFGKVVWEWNRKKEELIQVNTQKMPNGVYFLHLIDEQGNTQRQQIILNK